MRSLFIVIFLIIASPSWARLIISPEQLAQHNNAKDGIWVSYKGKVYDITHFVAAHPGGKKILQAAGGPLEPYWQTYRVHSAPHVQAMLKAFEIGELGGDLQHAQTADPFIHEPQRNSQLLVRSVQPFNAEAPLEILTDKLITPNELFYVRNHLPVPKIEKDTYKLELYSENKRLKSFTLEELIAKYPERKIVVTVQCAGNRRNEMANYKNVNGLNWASGAISTAEWTGVYLSDLLADINISSDAKYVQFEGFDSSPDGNYGGSIALTRAIDPKNEVLLAYKMNDMTLPIDHGYPLRVIVPGVVGARNVKWLSKIRVSKNESQSFWQQQDYKIFPSYLKGGEAKQVSAIQDMPIQSAIINPQPHAVASSSQLEVHGYAWSGGGRAIERVEISIDNGQNWQPATLHRKFLQPIDQAWAWTPWSVKLSKLPPGKVTIISRAFDSSQNSQPEHVQSIWNIRGLANNAWHRVEVNIQL